VLASASAARTLCNKAGVSVCEANNACGTIGTCVADDKCGFKCDSGEAFPAHTEGVVADGTFAGPVDWPTWNNKVSRAPYVITVHPNGEYALFVDQDDDSVGKLDLTTKSITKIVGGNKPWSNDDANRVGYGLDSHWHEINGLDIHPSGDYALATSSGNGVVKMIQLSGPEGLSGQCSHPANGAASADGSCVKVITVWGDANDRFPRDGFDNGVGITKARFAHPWGLDIDESGDFAVVLERIHNCYVRKIDLNTNEVTTIAELDGPHYMGIATEGGFAYAVQPHANPTPNLVRVNLATGARTKYNDYAGAYNIAIQGGVAIVPYMFGDYAHTVSSIDLETMTRETIAGKAGVKGNAGGRGADARFDGPMSVAFGKDYVLIGEPYSSREFRKIQSTARVK